LQNDSVDGVRETPRLRNQQKSTQDAERDCERDGAARQSRFPAQPVLGTFPVNDGALRE
jgi:hypothetical protein